jgi:hypothetical protein
MQPHTSSPDLSLISMLVLLVGALVMLAAFV